MLTKTLAQDQLTISGRVLDQKTSEPLGFASVGILRTSKGTVTNFQGSFMWSFSKDHLNDTLYISMLGYQPQHLLINKILQSGEVVVAMKEKVIMLEELQVHAKQPSADEIIANVLDNITVNYPVTPYLQEGFTRSYKRECGAYKSLYEAVFDLYGQGYHKRNPEKVYVKESRQSNTVDDYQSRVLRNNRNTFVHRTHINDVLFRSYSLKPSMNTYELESYTMIDGQLIYVIKTTHSKYVRHRMYINANDFALLKVTMNMETPEGEDWNPLLNKGPSSDSTDFQVTHIIKTLQFVKYEGKYFLKYSDWNIEGVLYSNDISDTFCDWGFRFEMMFDHFQTKNIARPPNKMQMIPKSRKDPKPMPYHANFWEQYPLLLDFPLPPKIASDLGGYDELEQQFSNHFSKMVK